jgi:hypothetical protein
VREGRKMGGGWVREGGGKRTWVPMVPAGLPSAFAMVGAVLTVKLISTLWKLFPKA